VLVELDRFVYREILNKLKYKEKLILEELEELSEKLKNLMDRFR